LVFPSKQNLLQGKLLLKNQKQLLVKAAPCVRTQNSSATAGVSVVLTSTSTPPEAATTGPRAIAIHAFTSLLFERKVEPAEFMRELFRRAEEEGLTGDSEAAIHEVLDMMACKAAIKAGDRLTSDELNELMRYREQVERSSNCPHGRPTSLRLSLRDLEKQFGRS
jgi:hypothetical protein